MPHVTVQQLNRKSVESWASPAPGCPHHSVVVRSCTSLISPGTERMLIDFGKANWIEKARQQPEKVRMVLERVKTDGVLATIESVRAKLDQPVALGYSNAGVVLEVGPDVTEFGPGDRVASNGSHAEVVSVPKNLCAKIPEGVTDDAAAFAVVAAIALQGIRLAAPTLGETFVVSGLGLIGLITVQLLRAHGCRVLGIDFDARKLNIAQSFGGEAVDLSAGEDPVTSAERFSRGRGVDAVIITASTKSNEPVHQAALMCRKRGRIVLVGVTGLELARDDFYKKELSFQVSCSYGPGRYDPAYEQGGRDYPCAHVRWTAQRNFEAVLDMMADGRLDVAPLITHRFPFSRVLEAYELLSSDQFYLGILLEYGQDAPVEQLTARAIPLRAPDKRTPAKGALGFIGAGSYAAKILIPAFKEAGASLVSVASNGGVHAAHAGRKFGLEQATTDTTALICDPRIDTVVIATRHDSHATLVCDAFRAGKNVFVEKPLALTSEQVDEIEAVYRSLPRSPLLMVGFNRRFSPHAVRARQLAAAMKGPKSFIYTVNAGTIPADHWTQDASIGGGRIAGEACHFIDLIRFLAASSITRVSTLRQLADTVTINLSFEDGSIGAVHYFATGHKSFPKERLEIFGAGRIIAIDNFRKMRAGGCPGFSKMNLWNQNKGATEMAAAFITAIRAGTPSPIPFHELIEVSRATIAAAAGN